MIVALHCRKITMVSCLVVIGLFALRVCTEPSLYGPITPTSEATRLLINSGTAAEVPSSSMSFIRISQEARGFVLDGTNQDFQPWGFNYDHDERGRLLEDYWEAEWAKVEEDFAEMRALGANCVRIHLQFGKFIDG
ncbi:MAG: hypothetical protein NZM31_02205, partial [Gemmatales bacterium]|nr:hypothetical protein [Gemmatales bacterium]MDW8385810.1 hypothetical protein [Gemmatales bacterium]